MYGLFFSPQESMNSNAQRNAIGHYHGPFGFFPPAAKPAPAAPYKQLCGSKHRIK
jgi:hypothetical protein